MATDRSLDEFLDHAEDSDTNKNTPVIELTYQGVPDGIQCTKCNATVSRRWNSDDGLVCEDCKRW